MVIPDLYTAEVTPDAQTKGSSLYPPAASVHFRAGWPSTPGGGCS